MAQLIFEVLALVAAVAVFRALVGWTGVSLPLPRAAVLTVAIVLVFTSVSTFRDSWHTVEVYAEPTGGIDAKEAREVCLGVTKPGDPEFLRWLKPRIPEGARFWMWTRSNLIGAGDICIRSLLMPRLPVSDMADAEWVIFFGDLPTKHVGEARRRGARLETFRKGYKLGRLP